MRITVDNIDQVLAAPPHQLPDILPKLFEKLVKPTQSEIFIQNYCGAIKQRFLRYTQPRGHVGFDNFSLACVDAGIIEAMLAVTQNDRAGMECAIAGYQALDALIHMLRAASVPERKMCLDQLLEHNVVNICLEKATSHELCVHRHVAVNMLRFLAGECFLADKTTSALASEIMVKMCQFVLTGPDFFVQQMRNPMTNWQSRMMMGDIGVHSSKSSKYALRYYAMAQECAIWATHGLLCTSPLPTRQFCLEIVKTNPVLIDLLFKCAVVPRPAWYPETQVDSAACEVLALLFQPSLEVVLGVPVPPEAPWKANIDSEWNAIVETLKILTSRPGWLKKVLAVWKKIDDEQWQNVKLMITNVKKDYYAQEPPDEQSFHQIFEYRGSTRICILRLIATLTYANSDCNVSGGALVSLLRIGYLGSQKIKTLDQLDPRNKAEHYTWIERAEEIFRSPTWTAYTGEKVDTPEHIVDEALMGPTALVRLLVVLAERGILSSIESWSALPDGTSSTSLGQAQQITSPDVIRAIVKTALKRVVSRREKGLKRCTEGDCEFARVAYTSAAELAAALVAFDHATAGKWGNHIRDAQKELAVCLGEAAEMALRLKQYRRALNFSLGAVAAGEPLRLNGTDAALLAKNTRRVEQARSKLPKGNRF